MENDLTIYDVIEINQLPTNEHAFITALADIMKSEGIEGMEILTNEL